MTSRPASLIRAAGDAIQKAKVTESDTLGGQGAPTRTECIKTAIQFIFCTLLGLKHVLIPSLAALQQCKRPQIFHESAHNLSIS